MTNPNTRPNKNVTDYIDLLDCLRYRIETASDWLWEVATTAEVDDQQLRDLVKGIQVVDRVIFDLVGETDDDEVEAAEYDVRCGTVDVINRLDDQNEAEAEAKVETDVKAESCTIENPADEAADYERTQVRPEHRQAVAARLTRMGHDLIALAESQLAHDCPQSPFAADSMLDLMEHLVECYGQARSGDEFDVLVEA